MPKRKDIEKILIIGSGPIIIGQACEFDYSGTQACKALAQEGYKVILVNSNPATIMTDPGFSYRTYIEPILPEVVEAIIRKERPQALLPTLGGQTALNVAVALARAGVPERYGVELIGANQEAIERAEERDKFKEVVEACGLAMPRSGYARSEEEAWEIVEELGYPVVLRPSFTLGGTGANVAYNQDEFREFIEWALSESPEGEVLVEESVIGWKEIELEVMRDKMDNVAVICSIENFDAMGIHTGDSITVAPVQTLTDREYQGIRDASLQIIRAVGVETGGSNIQFALNPRDGRLLVIEMNPRVSRSSALASKATGYPIAKIAAKLAVGLTLDEIKNDITLKTPASFEPAIDYCVVKFPRFTFEKFPEAEPVLGTQMRSVGEVMAIGRNFREALGKAIRSLEIARHGLEEPDKEFHLMGPRDRERAMREALKRPGPDRVWQVARALRAGMSVDECYELTAIDPWFLRQMAEVVAFEGTLRAGASGLTPSLLRQAKEHGYSDASIAGLTGLGEAEVRALRHSQGVKPVFKRVDTCAAEFEAYTPYLYSTYEEECEARPTGGRKVMILGSGPNRIGQGIEFDYCCVHGALAFAEAGFETIMVNCNPETVSTDYDTSDRLYFEPLTLEDVLAIVEVEKPEGVVVQFGGQTPLKLAEPLAREGVNILGTSVESIDRTEDRERFGELIQRLGLTHTDYGIAASYEEAKKVAERVGYPVVVRPSYVLGGRAMRIVYDAESLREYISGAVEASPERPILIDKFIDVAVEIDVDALADGKDVVVAAVMEHIEEAGVHSGDSACSLPAYSISSHMVEELKRQTRLIAKELEVVGLINIQFALKGGKVYVLEVNPRASRTVPFVSKATGLPLAKVASRVMAGASLKDLGITEDPAPSHIAVKEAVFPFKRFPGVDTLLGPEMKSTGEVMGIDVDFPMAFIKAQMGAGVRVPLRGSAFISVKDGDKEYAVSIARELLDQGFGVLATRGTWEAMRAAGLEAELVKKVKEGRPHIVDRMINGDVDLVINTTFGRSSVLDSYSIRRTALTRDIFYCTTIPGAQAAIRGIRALRERSIEVKPLQSYYGQEALPVGAQKVVN